MNDLNAPHIHSCVKNWKLCNHLLINVGEGFWCKLQERWVHDLYKDRGAGACHHTTITTFKGSAMEDKLMPDIGASAGMGCEATIVRPTNINKEEREDEKTVPVDAK